MSISTRSYCYLLICFALIIIGAQLTLLFANEYHFMLITGTYDYITSYKDILHSQYQNYLTGDGHIVANTIAQILLFWDKPLSSIAQAFCYLTLILFIYYNAYGIKPTLRMHFMPIFVISALLFIQLRVFGEVVFSIVGSSHYLFTTTLVLIFLLPYRISMKQDLTLNAIFLWPMIMVLGLLAGCTNENTATAVAIGLTVYFAYNIKQHRLKFWQILGFVCFLLSFSFMLYAPNNGVYFTSFKANNPDFNFVDHLIKAATFWGETLLLSTFLLVILAYIWWRVYEHYLQFVRKDLYQGSIWFIGMAFIALLVTIFAPQFTANTATPFTVFLITAILGFAEILFTREYDILSTRYKWILMTITSIFMISIVINMIYCGIILKEEQKTRYTEINKQLEQDQTNLIVTPLQIRNAKYIYVADVTTAADDWNNQIMKDYLQIDSIVSACSYPNTSSLYIDLIPFARRHDEQECIVPPQLAPALDDEY